MNATLPGLLAIFFYVLGSFYQGQKLARGRDNRRKVLFCGLIAVLSHLFNVYWVISRPEGLDLGFFNVATLFSWTIAVIVLVSSLRRPLENLLLALFPLAVISIILSITLEDASNPLVAYDSGLAGHILLAVLATSVITIAAVQAVFLAYQDHELKHKHHLKILRRLPPLQTMEELLFQ